jgi:RHS repeat-associated protein
MAVSGQTAITYGFDNANRLTQISQGSANVSFGYDNDSRRTSLTLPNGVSMNYSYDAASQLSGITYKNGSTTLGNLSYAYDLSGRREGVGGTYARTNTPQAASSASYNVNNQLTQWKGANLTYDANGNLTSDGTNTYTWNARNQLVFISGGLAASFQYDPFGRRVSKTIGGTTQFLYDGANPVQEISGTSAPANLLTGGVDEYLQRTDSAGARNFLTDALGSTLALTDSTGTLQTSYTFEPFGNTSVTGTTTTNSFAFTGRELDSTGLYFYRARYYSPTLQRFIGEDPIGFGGGINKYAYAGNNPISLKDGSGLQYQSPLPTSNGIGCNQYGIGCHSINDPADLATAEAQLAAEAKAAMAGRKPPACSTGSPNKHLSMGDQIVASTVNPFTSRGGGVFGFWNKQSFPATTNDYTFTGNGVGLDAGVSIQSVWAWGNGPWSGQFDSVNGSFGPFAGSIFWTPGEGGWVGSSFGLGLGLPGIAYEETNYTCRGPATW